MTLLNHNMYNLEFLKIYIKLKYPTAHSLKLNLTPWYSIKIFGLLTHERLR